VYYDPQAAGVLCTNPSLFAKALERPAELPSIETEHFDVNVFQTYQDMLEGDFSGLPIKQSKDVYDFTCKVINCRDLLLLVWRAVYCNKDLIAQADHAGDLSRKSSNSLDVDCELGFGEGMPELTKETQRSDQGANKSKHTSSFHSTTGKIFNFEVEDAFMDVNPVKREKKFSEEILDDLDALQTPNIYLKPSCQGTAHKEKDKKEGSLIDVRLHENFALLNPITGKMLKDLSEIKIVFYFLTFLAQTLNICYLFLFKLLSFILYSERFLNTTYSLLAFRLKICSKLNSKLMKLAQKQPSKNSMLLKEVAYILNTLAFNFFDLLFGWLFFAIFTFYGQEVAGLLRGLHNLIHPDVFKQQLALILENPAGIKLNPTYCGIISKLTQTIFLFQ
jgi:hypothetical protein